MTSFLKLALVVSMPFTVSTAWASCTTDTPELGDTGPSSQQVCHDIEAAHPGAHVAVKNRKPESRNKISIIANVDGKTVQLQYQRDPVSGWLVAQ